MQHWVRRRSCYLNLCEAHGLNSWGQVPHVMKSVRKISISWKTSCSSLSRVDIVITGLWFFSLSSNNMKWEYEWISTRRPVTNPVTGRRTSTVKYVTAWIAMRKRVTGKEFTLASWQTEIAKCRRARTTWTLCKRRTGEATPRAAKFGRIDNNRAQSPNWDLWIGKQSPIRYHVEKFWQLKDPWWSKTSQGRHGIISWNFH